MDWKIYGGYTMADELYTRLEKYMEGTSLGLTALAEVLTKMDSRLSKAEEDDEATLFAKEQDQARMSLVKDVASQVVSMLKSTDDLVDVGERKVKNSGAINQDGNDGSTTVSPATDAKNQQATLQAEEEPEDDDEAQEKMGKYPMKEQEDDDEAMEEAAADEDDDDDEAMEEAVYKQMRKEISSLKKQIAGIDTDLTKSVKQETAASLRKAGWKEERRLVAPTLSLGSDEMEIVKARPTGGELVDELANMSYSELRKLQYSVEQGDVTL
jgi:hypothetical protein